MPRKSGTGRRFGQVMAFDSDDSDDDPDPFEACTVNVKGTTMTMHQNRIVVLQSVM